MNRMLVISDTHGNSGFFGAIEYENADLVVHAGDSQIYDDAKALEKIDYIVLGNCDYKNFAEELTFTVGNKKIYLAHGHLFNVKLSLDKFIYTCLENEINIGIYGHSHIEHVQYLENDDLLIINPGSYSFGRGKFRSTYMILEFDDNYMEIFLKDGKTYETLKSFKF